MYARRRRIKSLLALVYRPIGSEDMLDYSIDETRAKVVNERAEYRNYEERAGWPYASGYRVYASMPPSRTV